MIGLPVYDRITGKRLGKCRDMIVDEAWRVRGILLEYKAWFAQARWVDWKDIVTFGEDAFLIRAVDAVRRWKPDGDQHLLCAGKHRVRGLPLITREGEHLGRVEDVYFSLKMEEFIVGFELSEGLLMDLREGRKRLPLPDGAVYGKDAILIPENPLEKNE